MPKPLARSVSARSDGLLNGNLEHPNKFSECQWNLHVITERANPKFVFAVGDEHGDAARIETGFQSNRSSVNGRSVLPWGGEHLLNLLAHDALHIHGLVPAGRGSAIKARM